MSISALSSTLLNHVNLQSPLQQLQPLGSELQSGNATQPDLVTLQSISLQPPVASPIRSIDPLEQQIQNQPPQRSEGHGHHHHYHAASEADPNQSGSTQASQLFDQLGQQIQSGNLTQAQTFATLQQNLQDFDLSPIQGDALSPAAGAVSVSA